MISPCVIDYLVNDANWFGPYPLAPRLRRSVDPSAGTLAVLYIYSSLEEAVWMFSLSLVENVNVMMMVMMMMMMMMYRLENGSPFYFYHSPLTLSLHDSVNSNVYVPVFFEDNVRWV